MFHFAFPIFFAGAALIAVPVLLHFLKRRPHQIQDFPSFYFLKQNVQRRKRRNSLRSLIVMLLRLLALACLAAAFAWPYIGAIGEHPDEATVIICDRSFSAEDPEFCKVRNEILQEELAKVSPQTPAIAILAGDRLEVSGTSFCGSGSVLEEFFSRERQLAPTSCDFSLALYRADGLLGTVNAPKRSIVVITDRQKLPWKRLPEGNFLNSTDEIRILPTTHPVPVNARIDSAKRTGDQLKVILYLTGTKQEQSATLELFEEDKSLWKQDIKLEPGRETNLTVNLKGVLSGGKPGHLKLSCSQDVIPADNDWYFPPLPENSRTVQLFSSQKYPALNAALESAEIKFTESEEWQGNPDLIIVGDSPLSDPLKVCEELERRLKNGAAVALLYSDTPFLRKLFEHFGAAPGEGTQDTLTLEMIDLEHPIFRAYQDLGTASWFDILFFNTPKLNPPAAARILASWEGGRPAIAEIPFQKGKVFFLAFAPSPEQTNFQTSGHFLPFWRELLQYGAVQHKKDVEFHAANKTIMTPDGELDLSEPGTVKLDETIYCINADRQESGAEQLPGSFAVHTERSADAAATADHPHLKYPNDTKYPMLLLLAALLFLMAELGLSNRTAI